MRLEEISRLPEECSVTLLQAPQAMPTVIHIAHRRKASIASHELRERLSALLDLAHRVFGGIGNHAGKSIVLRSLNSFPGFVGHEVAHRLLHEFAIINLRNC